MTDIRFYDPRRGDWCMLSNLYEAPITFDGVTYATPEHAFQVARARDPALKAWIASAPTPEFTAIIGDALTCDQTTDGWADMQLDVMARILAIKFADPRCRALLRSTGDAYLVEWTPVDYEIGRFWGEYLSQGTNHLGHLLMALRDRLATSA